MNNILPDDEIRLSDVIELNILKDFLKAFTESTGMAAIVVDKNGPVTEPFNFTELCLNYIKNSPEGYKRCNQCDISFGMSAAKSCKPVIYSCHSGLTTFAVPITVKGQHLASILGGQVLISEPDENRFRQLARELELNEDEYIAALRKIPIIPYEKVEAAANVLFLAANSISKIAYKNNELIKRSKKAAIYKSILESIRSSLDINEIKKNIVTEVGKHLGAYRCFLLSLDINNKFLKLDENSIYELTSDAPSLNGIDPEDGVASVFLNELKLQKEVTVLNLNEFVKINHLQNSTFNEYIKNFRMEKVICMPLTYSGNYLGTLVIYYDTDKDCFTEDVTDFLKAISTQTSLALHQNRQYLLQRRAAQREALLRRIADGIKNNIDIQKTFNFVSSEIARFFNVPHVLVVKFSYVDLSNDYGIKCDYSTNPDLKILDLDNKDRDTELFWEEHLLKNNDVYAINKISSSFTPDYFKDSYSKIGVESILSAAIQDEKNTWGRITLLDYSNDRLWTDDDCILLSSIANQLYSFIQHADLYSTIIKQSERENAILNNLPFMAWLKDEKSRFLAINDTFINTCNLQNIDVYGKTDFNIFPPEIAKKYIDDDLKVMKTAKKLYFKEKIYTKDGIRWFETYKSPVFNHEKKVVGTTGFSIDITQREEIECVNRIDIDVK